ncbi:MAG: toxin-antitoxin system HicB family antitoxin [Sphingomonadaceae bacterium]|nr:toxin-antitoxin system HicB family antitoxin [Sphingomonadaceae bacterium]
MSIASKKSFPLRLDPALYAALERAAAADLRSVNAQIEVLLREALARRGIKVSPAQLARRGRPPKEKTDE